MRISANVTASSGDPGHHTDRSDAGMGYSDRTASFSQIGFGLSHRFASSWMAVKVVQKAIEGNCGEGRLSDIVVPMLCRWVKKEFLVIRRFPASL
jgi:hypothetical protein